MKNTLIRSLSIAVAIILATMLSFAVIAEDESGAVSDVSSVEVSDTSSAEVSDTASDEASAETSAEVSDETSDVSDETSGDESSTGDESSKGDESNAPVANNNTNNAEAKSDFPWARVITLIVIVVAILALVIVANTKTAFGQKIAKFFKEYISEIKKISWSSPKDTAKATGVVLVFIIVAAIVIGVLDYGFTQLIKLLADLV